MFKGQRQAWLLPACVQRGREVCGDEPRGGPRAAGKHAVLLLPRPLRGTPPCWTQERADPGACGGVGESCSGRRGPSPQLTAAGPAGRAEFVVGPTRRRSSSSGCGPARWTRPADVADGCPDFPLRLVRDLGPKRLCLSAEQSPRPRPDSSCPPAPAV